MKLFFDRVRAKLAEQNHKRSWLLARTRIKPSTWSSWEKWDRLPSVDQALAIAEALEVDLEFLVTGKETSLDLRRGNPLVQQICRQLEHLNERQLKRVLNAVNSVALEE
jgi:transcriptional regulator with XRE-family HTH domain